MREREREIEERDWKGELKKKRSIDRTIIRSYWNNEEESDNEEKRDNEENIYNEDGINNEERDSEDKRDNEDESYRRREGQWRGEW